MASLKIIPYQVCPMCEGDCELYNGKEWFECHICHGKGIIPMYVEEQDYEIPIQIKLNGEIQENLC
jgi:DnaJ-class molecular chaperone